MKLTDYVIQFLAERGVKHVFGLTGGAAVHLFDSADRSGIMQPVFNHHEQAGSFAAPAYAKVNRRLGACFVTTGPGGTNAVTGLAAAWLDSVPCFFISGQARLAHTTQGKRVRQIGTQQLDIISIVKSMTNYAVMIEDAKSIRYHMEKAYHLATQGRPGPVWLDIPLDLQWADIRPDQLKSFEPEPRMIKAEDASFDAFCELFKKSERPIVIAGAGVRLAGAEKEFEDFVHSLDLPFITTWGAVDLLPSSDPLHLGRPGVSGQRGANLAMQNADWLICLGTHLCVPVTSTIFKSFAREAKIVMIDIDRDELDERTIPVDLGIQMDVRSFLNGIKNRGICSNVSGLWQEKLRLYREYNFQKNETSSLKKISPYHFVSSLSNLSSQDDIIVVDGGGTNVYVSFQTWEIKRGQRMILSTGLCSMGSGLPESIGACFAANRKRTICLYGDGSLQLNIQELQTVKHHKLPVKIFVSNNEGYVSIRHTQEGFLGGNFVGSAASGGMSLPDYVKIAQAYGIRTLRIQETSKLEAQLKEALSSDDPVLCEVVTDPDFELNPRTGFDRRADGSFAPRPLEDMAPYLDREEFARLMIVKLWAQ